MAKYNVVYEAIVNGYVSPVTSSASAGIGAGQVTENYNWFTVGGDVANGVASPVSVTGKLAGYAGVLKTGQGLGVLGGISSMTGIYLKIKAEGSDSLTLGDALSVVATFAPLFGPIGGVVSIAASIAGV